MMFIPVPDTSLLPQSAPVIHIIAVAIMNSCYLVKWWHGIEFTTNMLFYDQIKWWW